MTISFRIGKASPAQVNTIQMQKNELYKEY